MTSLAANLAVAASILLVGVSLALLGLGLLSWQRVRHPRLLWVALAFALLAVQGVLLGWASYQKRAEVAAGDTLLPAVATVGLGTAIALYAAVLKR